MRVVDRLSSPTAARLLRSYGLVLLIALVFLVVVLFVPTLDRTVPVEPSGMAPSFAPPGSGHG